MLEESPATPMETFPLQFYSSVLLNPSSLMTSVNSVLVTAHTACKMPRWCKEASAVQAEKEGVFWIHFFILRVLLCK